MTALPAGPILDALLRERFGIPALRGLQGAVIEAVLAGRDILALMPTGAGKSLCFQLPAALRPGLTLVVSPLTALMREQERRLAALGIPALALAGPLSPEARRAAWRALRAGSLRVLLVSPERLLRGPFLADLADAVGAHGVWLLVIDEAHCIAEWGPEFRPEFAELGRLRDTFPAAAVLALTASADARVRSTILKVLRMPADCVLSASFDRPEIFYRVGVSPAPWLHALAYLQAYHPAACALFYCQRRSEAEAVARLLCGHGVPALCYHAGLPAPQRRAAESWFARCPGAVMAATIAFGMGIDKPDIRLVVHRGLQRSLAAYYQETGRAGRDGGPADALLLLEQAEIAAAQAALASGEAAEGSAFLRFALGRECRRVALLAAFGEAYGGECTGCDRCAPGRRPLPALRGSAARWVPGVRARAPRSGSQLR